MSHWFPPDQRRPAHPQFANLAPGTLLTRIYTREPHNSRADSFRHYGPKYRFDHHQFPPGAPANDPQRGILYASESTPCCFLEVFYETGVVTPVSGEGGLYRLATLQVRQPLLLLKLDGDSAAIDAGTTANIFTEPHNETQPWAQLFYDDTKTYRAVDGISYHSSHGNQVAVALFERAKGKLDVVDDPLFTDPSTRNIIIQLAERYHFIVDGL